MSKAVLISIRPKWCDLILTGKKSIEIRKTAPKIETPFKCYIYCTKFHPGDPDSMINLKGRKSFFMPQSCMVIGHFVCDRIIKWNYVPDPDESADPGSMAYDVLTVDGEATGLEYDDFEDYGKGAILYGWHISDLVIYDKPKSLNEFYRWYEDGDDVRPCQNGKICEYSVYDYSEDCEACSIDYDGTDCPFFKVTRPPQSWCYVEDTDG